MYMYVCLSVEWFSCKYAIVELSSPTYSTQLQVTPFPTSSLFDNESSSSSSSIMGKEALLERAHEDILNANAIGQNDTTIHLSHEAKEGCEEWPMMMSQESRIWTFHPQVS